MTTFLSDTKSIMTIALPLMAAFFAQKGMQLIDTVMMGWIGPEALAAGILSTSIFIINVVFCAGTLSAVGIQIARARGANQYQDIPKILQHGVYLVLLLTLPCMMIIWYTPYLLSYLGSEPIVVVKSTEFLHGLVWGLPGFLMFFLFRELVAAFSRTRMVMIIVICILPLTFIGNYICIYGKLGLPVMGVVGIGYAGAVVMWMMFFSLYSYARLDSHVKKHFFFSRSNGFDIHMIKSMLSVGVPSGLIFVLDSGMFAVGTMLMASFGVDALAAHSIAMQCASFVYAIPVGLSMAVALQVGHAVGAKDLAHAKRTGYIGLMLAFIFAFLVGIIFIGFPDAIIKIFLDANAVHYLEIRQFATTFLFIAALFQAFDVMQAVMNGALRGFKDTLYPMLLCISCFWGAGIGGAYYLGFHTHFGATGIWIGLTLGLMSASVVLLLRFLKKPTHF